MFNNIFVLPHTIVLDITEWSKSYQTRCHLMGKLNRLIRTLFNWFLTIMFIISEYIKPQDMFNDVSVLTK